jgi:hypothetical protein
MCLEIIKTKKQFVLIDQVFFNTHQESKDFGTKMCEKKDTIVEIFKIPVELKLSFSFNYGIISDYYVETMEKIKKQK